VKPVPKATAEPGAKRRAALGRIRQDVGMAALRFGLLGTGYWALHTHGTALCSSRHANLHGVWGRDPAKTHDLAKRLGARGYDDLDRLLDEVDAVAIAVPPAVQADLAVKAAQAGCHLLLEKPLAVSVLSAQAVVRAVEEAGVASVVFFTARYRPEVERWTEAAAQAGLWHSAHLVQYANIFQPGSPYSESAWRREYGALWDVGPHALSSLLPIMGKVTSVAARSGPAGSDTVHLILTHGPHPAGVPHTSPPTSAAHDANAGRSQNARPAGTTADGLLAVGTASDEPAPASAGTVADVPVGPVSASTLSLSLTMPPAATVTHLAIYGEHGVRTRPEGSFEPVEALHRAIADLASLVESGQRHHRCDVHFGLEVVRVLAAAERALELRAVELRY
jgi:predicted dehydrogenase